MKHFEYLGYHRYNLITTFCAIMKYVFRNIKINKYINIYKHMQIQYTYKYVYKMSLLKL